MQQQQRSSLCRNRSRNKVDAIMFAWRPFPRRRSPSRTTVSTAHKFDIYMKKRRGSLSTTAVPLGLLLYSKRLPDQVENNNADPATSMPLFHLPCFSAHFPLTTKYLSICFLFFSFFILISIWSSISGGSFYFSSTVAQCDRCACLCR